MSFTTFSEERVVLPPASALDEPPLALRVRCSACGKDSFHDVGRVIVFPSGSAPEGSDGIVFSRIFTCVHCGAEDDYALTLGARGRVLAELARARFRRDPLSGRVVQAKPQLGDGSCYTRPSQALRHLRSIAESRASCGESWRRLGNFAERCERMEDARSAWEKAIEVDEHEIEAAYSLARTAADAEELESCLGHVGEALRRLPRHSAESKERLITSLGLASVILQLAEEGVDATLTAAWRDETHDGDPIVRMSGVRFECIQNEDDLAELLASDELIAATVTKDAPDGEPSQLEVLLSGDELAAMDLVPSSVLPSPPHGSGASTKKRKEARKKKRKAQRVSRRRNR